VTSQKQHTWLPARSRAMVDKCSFCAEWHSIAIVRDNVILAHTDCKEMDVCSIRAFL